MQSNADMEIDGRKKSCTGIIAELEKAMNNSNISRISIIVQDVPTKIDVYAWAKRKGHTVTDNIQTADAFKMEVTR